MKLRYLRELLMIFAGTLWVFHALFTVPSKVTIANSDLAQYFAANGIDPAHAFHLKGADVALSPALGYCLILAGIIFAFVESRAKRSRLSNNS